MSNETQALFASANAAFQGASADTGGGSIWPPAGMHACILDRIEVQPNQTFRQRDEHGGDLPATRVTFVWQLCEDPDRAEALTFPGEPFDIPLNPGAITADGQKKRLEISLSRLKGHLTTVLRKSEAEVADIGSAIAEAQGLTTGEAAVICTVECREREYNDRTYHTEFVKERIA